MRFLILLAGLCLGLSHNVSAMARPLVAVIDSGIARTPELEGVLIAEHDMASDMPRPAFQPRYDHGTMVATILTREAQGQVDIVSLRIDDPAGCPAKATPPCQPSADVIARAIRKGAELGAAAINISLSMADDARIIDAVRDVARQGVTVVLAAGYPRTVLVGAVDPAGRPWSGTNKPDAKAGRSYDYVWQQGVGVSATAANGAPVAVTGTSFATPIETARRMAAGAVLAAR